MNLTRRGKAAITVGAILGMTTVTVGALALTGNAPAPLQRVVDRVTGRDRTPPPTCPLTGKPAPGGEVPDRPVLAVKVENTPEARPQAGLQNADVVYEEPVEGGITRFVAVYQCKDAPRVGPVRSGRTTDPKVLGQFGERPLIAYSGAAPRVAKEFDRSGLVSLTDATAVEAFWRDEARPAPHDLFTSTKRLYAAGRSKQGAPEPVFAFGDETPVKGKRIVSLSAEFSFSSVAEWRWSPAERRWVRMLDGAPMTLESGEPISAANVIVQHVVVTVGDIIDAAGNPSPEVAVTGTGKAWVLRDGRVFVGRWVREDDADVTSFVTGSGDVIPLVPGNTWIELVPKGNAVTFARP